MFREKKYTFLLPAGWKASILSPLSLLIFPSLSIFPSSEVCGGGHREGCVSESQKLKWFLGGDSSELSRLLFPQTIAAPEASSPGVLHPLTPGREKGQTWALPNSFPPLCL